MIKFLCNRLSNRLLCNLIITPKIHLSRTFFEKITGYFSLDFF